jgi:cation diffusion facilitator family transporter
MTNTLTDRSTLTRFAWLSIGAAVLTIGLKTVAYWVTGSVGLLSDAMESGVNLVGALMALAMLTIAALPADDDHMYGHSKAEYFSSGVEGILIIVAAFSIGYTAIERLLNPKEIESLGLGMMVSFGASLVNFVVARILAEAGKKNHSITLLASSKHLMTDVWTSVGVLVAVGAVVLTGWLWLDPVIALAVAANIIWSGVVIVKESVKGLMDSSISEDMSDTIMTILDSYTDKGMEYHELRTRQSGARQFISVHILVPGTWTVNAGHQLVHRIETEIHQALPDSTVISHLESLDDPDSFETGLIGRKAPKSKPNENQLPG